MRMWTHTQLLVDISVAQDWCDNDLFPRQCLVLRSIETVAAPGGGYLGKSVTTRSHLEFPVLPGNEEFAEIRQLMATERVSLCLDFFGWEVMAYTNICATKKEKAAIHQLPCQATLSGRLGSDVHQCLAHAALDLH